MIGRVCRLALGGLIMQHNAFLSRRTFIGLGGKIVVFFRPCLHIGDVLKVFVKAVHPSNGRFRLTLDPAITPEKANRMKNAAMRARSRFSMRKQAVDLEPGEEILGEIVKASLICLRSCCVMPHTCT